MRLITIAIPTFNRAGSTLPLALQSALAQTYQNLEVVVSDNASDDGTEALVAVQRDPRLRYYRHAANIGAAGNMNSCLDVARGEYVLVLPDDDLVERTFVERAVAAMGTGEPGVVLGGACIVDARGEVRSRAPAPEPELGAAGIFLSWFAREAALYMFSTLYHTERLRSVGGFVSPEGLYDDVVAIAVLASRYGYVSVPGEAGSFRRHGDNMGSGSHALRWARDSEFLLDVLCRELPRDASRLRRSGAPYLAGKCYRYVSGVRSPIERLRLYREIDRRFGHTYSPVRFVAKQMKRRWQRELGDWARRLGVRRARGRA